jgi:hypothetical protein
VTILILAPVFIFASFQPVPPLIKISDRTPPGILLGKLEYIEETQAVWQIPVSPKAVLFLAHGCHGRASFFWDKNPSCAECLGLPEERIITLNALMRGYAVIAISSTRECWSLSTDKAKVLSILSGWIRNKGLQKLPIVALGASSGGFLVSALAREYRFSAIVVMISEGSFHNMEIGGSYPATLFVHMVKDVRRAALIKAAMDMLRSKGIETSEVLCHELTVTPDYFTKIPGLDSETSHKIQQIFKQSDVLDDNNLMMMDGRAMNWMTPLKAKKAIPDTAYKLWDLHMQELLNLAFGYHEITSLPSTDIFDWLDAQVLKGRS